MNDARTLADVMSELARAAAVCEHAEDELADHRGMRDDLVLEAIRRGASERQIAAAARLSGPRIHQIKAPLMYAVQIIDGRLRDLGDSLTGYELTWRGPALSTEEAVQFAEQQWADEFGKPVPTDALVRFGNTEQPN
jgi:hypothetical protein